MNTLPTPPGPGKGGRSRISGIIGPTDDDSHAPSDRVSLWSPTGFDPGEYLPPDLRRHGDCARFLLHRVIVKGLNDRRFRGEFVPLKAEYLRKFFPTRKAYGAIREGLVNGGAIVCDRRYVVGSKAFGYKLGPGLAARRHEMVEVTNRALRRKILDAPHRPDLPSPVHRHLFEHLRSVEIDYPNAVAWLDARPASEFEGLDYTACQLIRDREFYFHVCRYGRVHTNITNLRSGLRSFLTCRGQPLVSLDVRNSQPLFLAVLLRQTYAGRATPPDVGRYVDLCQDGTLYDHLMAEQGIPAERRSKFKKSFFASVLFCENSPETDAAKAFGRSFPGVYRVIRQWKAEDYTELAKALQRAESNLMIGGVVRRLATETPGVFLTTVHDSVLATPDRAGAVGAVMTAEFARIGLKPTLNVEYPEDCPLTNDRGRAS